ncbi:alkylhydroperoxidase like protein, AhpD family [Beutenbergia cavernae DSM 12333]|uniref:Alkylhydroperoxidase like protein, AhpD family n=1 Tax=Beutenbergia cavernae (strain ATCC BAA-8 / DSM 12333 / CCUG 43141 / JCM 11478 / NBRC 16432 / NCIMB 13614 / HKI 0122) TaxID=471853 RepID=C5C2S0_BEUC1|nr:carboxymuconolactone decarboxylase family protein [Beutenbergia cavernae]ACQ81764.1 alkylhydroperoxidase like protein, AhpD family [Beutenbergia cavernae DSM 12333]
MPRVSALPAERVSRVKRALYRMSRRKFGEVLQPMQVWAHHGGVFWTSMLGELGNARMRAVLPVEVKDLVVHRVSVLIGCPWCIDFGAMESLHAGLTPERVMAVPDYADSPLFTAAEKAAMAYADAMTAQPPRVTDEQVAALRRTWGDAGLVELTYHVAVENQRSRFNHALGITAQGFTDQEVCALPPVR